MKPFHLSLAVPDLASARAFYQGVLGCAPGRVNVDWIDVHFFGHQLTLHQATASHPAQAIDHFGVLLDCAEWRALAEACRQHGVPFSLQPRVLQRGERSESGKFIVRDPAGNTLEFKYPARVAAR